MVDLTDCVDAVFILFDYLWNEMNADYGSFSSTVLSLRSWSKSQTDGFADIVVIQATNARVLEALDEAKGDIHLLQIELQAQSVTRTNTQRRAPSRSMEDFLTKMNPMSSSAPATNGVNLLSSTPPSSAPSNATSSSQESPQSANLLSLDSPLTSSTKAAFNGSTQSTETLLDLDPFSGNDIRGLEVKIEEQGDDPFACLF